MFRVIIILLASILLITVLRAIMGMIMRGFSDMVRGDSETAPPAGPRKPDVPVAGELKRDPVCGTFVSVATSLNTTARGETVYFCSAACRDKYRV
jgi:YHS domain-containing protein